MYKFKTIKFIRRGCVLLSVLAPVALAEFDPTARLYAIPELETGTDIAENSDRQQKPGQLNSILVSQTRKVAIIDGKMVKEGDEILGGKLLKITPKKVTIDLPEGPKSLGLYPSIEKVTDTSVVFE